MGRFWSSSSKDKLLSRDYWQVFWLGGLVVCWNAPREKFGNLSFVVLSSRMWWLRACMSNRLSLTDNWAAWTVFLPRVSSFLSKSVFGISSLKLVLWKHSTFPVHFLWPRSSITLPGSRRDYALTHFLAKFSQVIGELSVVAKTGWEAFFPASPSACRNHVIFNQWMQPTLLTILTREIKFGNIHKNCSWWVSIL